MALGSKFAWTVFALQLIFIVLFAFFVRYGPDLDAANPKNAKAGEDGKLDELNRNYPVFQDINAMIFIGIGFLYAYLRRYGYTGVGMNFFLSAICLQWGVICQGLWKMKDGKIDITIISLMKGEFAAASAMIAMGAVFGKVGLLQLITFCMLEVLVYSALDQSCKVFLQIADVGESVALHMFCAIYGCSTAFIVDKKVDVQDNPNEKTTYNSNLICMLGTLLLWVFWPSFNAANDVGDSQYRSVVNSVLALVGSGITCFAMSALVHKENKFTMSHIQNAALAGAVGIGTTSDMMVQPFGALAIGALSGCICVAGFKYLTPFLAKHKVYDPCGINSLHGLPGLFAGILGILATFLANEKTYSYSLYKFYPAMAPMANTTALIELRKNASRIIEPGLGRTAESQAVYQLIYVVVAIVVACLTGLITGAILRMKILDPLEGKQMYLDDLTWDLSGVDTGEAKRSTEDRSNCFAISEKL